MKFCSSVALLALTAASVSAFAPSPQSARVVSHSSSTQRFSSVAAPYPASNSKLVATPPDVVYQEGYVYKLYELPTNAKTKSMDATVSVGKFASVFVATVGTYYMNNVMAMGAVKASSITATIAALLLPQTWAVGALCGSFAGMASTAVIPNMVGTVGALGLLTAVMMAFFDYKKVLLGTGGRLGLIAQCACTTQFFLAALFAAPGAPSTGAAMISVAPWDMPKLLLDLPTVASFTALGALVTKQWMSFKANASRDLADASEEAFTPAGKWLLKILSWKTGMLSRSVGAVGGAGLLASTFLPAHLVGPFFCGSFVAMSAKNQLPDTTSMFWAAMLAGVAQFSLNGVLLGGWGGKLGTAAAMGVVAYTKFANREQPEEIEFVLNESDFEEGELPVMEHPEVKMIQDNKVEVVAPAKPAVKVTSVPEGNKSAHKETAVFTVVTNKEEKEAEPVLSAQEEFEKTFFGTDFNI